MTHATQPTARPKQKVAGAAGAYGAYGGKVGPMPVDSNWQTLAMSVYKFLRYVSITTKVISNGKLFIKRSEERKKIF